MFAILIPANFLNLKHFQIKYFKWIRANYRQYLLFNKTFHFPKLLFIHNYVGAIQHMNYIYNFQVLVYKGKYGEVKQIFYYYYMHIWEKVYFLLSIIFCTSVNVFLDVVFQNICYSTRNCQLSEKLNA